MPLVTIYLDEKGKNSIQSVLATIIRGEDCWEWPLGKRGAYKHLTVAGKPQLLHRLVYEQLVGPIPKRYEIDHLCRNPSCCNPKHLEAVPKAVNIQRGNSMSARWGRRTHCEKGHPFDEQNTHIRVRDGVPNRQCRICLAQHHREKYERQQARTGKVAAKGMPHGASTCKRGHAFTEGNLTKTPDGRRRCKTCAEVRRKKYLVENVGKTKKVVKSVCKRGHLRTGGNLYTAPNGTHQCRECRRLQTTKQNNKRREQRRAKAATVP